MKFKSFIHRKLWFKWWHQDFILCLWFFVFVCDSVTNLLTCLFCGEKKESNPAIFVIPFWNVAQWVFCRQLILLSGYLCLYVCIITSSTYLMCVDMSLFHWTNIEVAVAEWRLIPVFLWHVFKPVRLHILACMSFSLDTDQYDTTFSTRLRPSSPCQCFTFFGLPFAFCLRHYDLFSFSEELRNPLEPFACLQLRTGPATSYQVLPLEPWCEPWVTSLHSVDFVVPTSACSL